MARSLGEGKNHENYENHENQKNQRTTENYIPKITLTKSYIMWSLIV